MDCWDCIHGFAVCGMRCYGIFHWRGHLRVMDRFERRCLRGWEGMDCWVRIAGFVVHGMRCTDLLYWRRRLRRLD